MNQWKWIVCVVCVGLILGCAMQPVRDTWNEELSTTVTPVEPQWSVTLAVKELERVVPLGPERVLVRELDMYGMGSTWAPRYGSLIAYDLKSGEELWRILVESQPGDLEEILTVGDRIVLTGRKAGGSVMLGYDSQSGVQVWEYGGTEGVCFDSKIVLDLKRAFVPVPVSGGARVEAVDLINGETIWTSAVLPEGFASQHHVLAMPDKTLVLGPQVVCMNTSDGEILWTAGVEMAGEGNPRTDRLGNRIIGYEAGDVWMIDLEKGEIVWSESTGDEPVVLAALTPNHALLVRTVKPGEQIEARDLETGVVVWAHATDEPIRSLPVLTSDGRLLYTGTAELVGLDAATGQELFRSVLPESLRSPRGLPDHIELDNGRIVVAREIGVAVFAAGGEPIYHHAVAGAFVLSDAFLSKKLALRLSRGAADTRMSAVSPATTVNLQPTLQLQRSYADYVNTQADSVISSSSSTAADRQTAYLQKQVAAESTHAMEMAAANQQMIQAALGLGTAMSNLGTIIYRQGFVEASIDINVIQQNKTGTTHLRSLQRGYYVRPFYREQEGWGVTLVRLADGARCDLVVSSDNEALILNGVNNPVFIVSPDGESLLVKGLGSAPQQFYVQVSHPYHIKFFPENYSIPYPSLMSYRIADLTFEADRKWPSVEWPSVGDKEMALRRAVFAPDLEEIDRLLEEGADPDRVDEFGFNTMIYGAILDNKKVVKKLLKAGANASVRDYHGWLPWHYTFLNNPSPVTTTMLGKAVK